MKAIKLYALTALAAVLLAGCASNSTDKTANSTQASSSEKSSKELDKITKDYRIYVEGQVDRLLSDTEKFAETLKSGDLEAAKQQYPLIRMAYERSEPIAESFAELDVRIDYRLVDYKDENNTEEGWSGYHPIERILWEQHTTAGTERYASQLVNDIKELRAKVSTVEVTPDLMVTGATDLLNEVATTKITGEEEIYSHTDLYDFRANIEGAEKIFDLFKPVLKKKDAQLVTELNKRFKAVHVLLDKYMTDDKHYVSYTDLTKENTKELSEAVTDLGNSLQELGIVIE